MSNNKQIRLLLARVQSLEDTNEALKADKAKLIKDSIDMEMCDRCKENAMTVRAVERAEKAEAERDFFSKRDCNATVQLSYSTKDYPFNTEELKIVDVGVSDNTYIVESELFNSIQAERDRLRESDISQGSGDLKVVRVDGDPMGKEMPTSFVIASECSTVTYAALNHKEG